MFGAAAIEKYCTLFELYQNSKTKIGSRKENGKENMFGFIIENVSYLNVKKLYNITLERTRPILHIKSENVFDRS